MNFQKNFGPVLLTIFFIFILIAGIISYQSIDWTVLTRLENQQITLPTPIPTNTATSSAVQN